MSVGFRAKNGDTVYWQNGEKTTFTDTGPVFPSTTRAFYARYGQPRSEPDPDKRSTHLIVEAETVFVQLGRAMINAAEDPNNPWGFEFSGIPEATPLELYDFAATQMPRGWAGSDIKKLYFDPQGGTNPRETSPDGAIRPKIPSPTIYKISSPEPGSIRLAWRTKMNFQYEFMVRVFRFGIQVLEISAGTVREAVLTLPAGVGGLMEVLVVAMKDGVLGVAGPSRFINVEAKDRQDDKKPAPVPNPLPTPPLPPLPTPTPVPVPSPVLSSPEQRADELLSWVEQKFTQLRPALKLVVAEMVVMFRRGRT